jgi:hypothetical protein
MTDADARATALYDQLLASVAKAAPLDWTGCVVAHWPHVGSAYDGVVILGQALYGWPDDFDPHSFQDVSKRVDALDVIRGRNTDRDEPMDWIANHPVRRSPFWTVARLVTEALAASSDQPWFSRLAWANLYPVAPERGNPEGWLREAQNSHVGSLIETLMELLEARVVVALVGPYWWPAGSLLAFDILEARDRPLSRSGLIDGRAWVVGWHPGGASRRGYGPTAYAEIVVREARRLLAQR